MKKKFMLASALLLAVGIGTVQPVLAQEEGEPTSEGSRLFLGCGVTHGTTQCTFGQCFSVDQTYIFGIAVGAPTIGTDPMPCE